MDLTDDDDSIQINFITTCIPWKNSVRVGYTAVLHVHHFVNNFFTFKVHTGCWLCTHTCVSDIE